MHDRLNSDSVLVLWFDGLDYELIQEFDLEHVTQDEFGTLDNDTGICKRKTIELGASLVTGETHDTHGVKKMKKWSNPSVEKFENKMKKLPLEHRFRDLRRGFYRGIQRFDTVLRCYNHSDYEQSTLFDQIDNSQAFYVPGYNTGAFFSKMTAGSELQDYDVENTPRWKYWDRYVHFARHRTLFNKVNPYLDLCMFQFHRPDIHQHHYGTPGIHYDKQKLRKLYKETDELAGDIIERFEDSYDTIIFLSDHGLPEGDQHNKNAFYSCNKKLFGKEQPHITDFHDKILREIVETQRMKAKSL
jgi:hypothetical protein